MVSIVGSDQNDWITGFQVYDSNRNQYGLRLNVFKGGYANDVIKFKFGGKDLKTVSDVLVRGTAVDRQIMRSLETEIASYQGYEGVEVKNCTSAMHLTTEKDTFALTFSDCADNLYHYNMKMATLEDSYPFRARVILFSALMSLAGVLAGWSNYQLLD